MCINIYWLTLSPCFTPIRTSNSPTQLTKLAIWSQILAGNMFYLFYQWRVSFNEIFLFSDGYRAHPAPCSVGTRSAVPGSKVAWAWSLPLPSSTEVKNVNPCQFSKILSVVCSFNVSQFTCCQSVIWYEGFIVAELLVCWWTLLS
jgi:hypothetical protein